MNQPKIIALDFDGCLVTNKWPEIGEPIQQTLSKLRLEQNAGAKVILWTCRVGEMLDEAVEWCKNQDIHLDAVNQNLPEIIKEFGDDSRKIFANEYWDDRAVLMCEEEESSIVAWAEREVQLVCDQERGEEDTDDFDYGGTCYESALRAIKTLAKDGHSGFSIRVTKHILNRLIDGKPLTPIEDTDDVWKDVTQDLQGSMLYQNKRMNSLFKRVYENGKIVYSDNDHSIGVDIHDDSTFGFGLVHRIVDEMWPISMPYMPEDQIRVYTEDCSFDPENGDFDTFAIFYAMKDGEKVEINRFFKESKNDWEEIDVHEYEQRRDEARKRGV